MSTRAFCISLLVLIGFGAMAQPFDNRFGNFLEDEMRLAREFAGSNGILEVVVEHSLKRPNEPIKPTNSSEHYRYDRQGRLIELVKIRNERDTAVSRWVFDGNILDQRIRQDALGLYSEEYDSLPGGDIQITYTRNQKLISRERIRELVSTDTLRISKHYNSDDIHYKTTRVHLNANGSLQREVIEYQFGGRKTERIFSYNAQGWISEIRQQKNGKYVVKKYSYSDLGELMFVESSIENEMKNRLEVLYEDGLPDAFINKETATNHLKIAKFEYTFR